MGMYKYLSQMWQDKKEEMASLTKARMIAWRKAPSFVVCDGPTRLDKARMMGYKAKQGIIVVRVKLLAGGRQRHWIVKGRKPRSRGHYYSTTKNLQAISELRVARKFPNMEVLNSYYVGGDSKNLWYEVILVDRTHPAIISDKDLRWIIGVRGRAARGLTSAGQRSKGARRIETKEKPKRQQKERTRIIKRRR